MKKSIIVILIVLILMFLFGCLEYSIYKMVLFPKKSKETLNLAYELIQNENLQNERSVEDEIRDINLNKNITSLKEIVSEKEKIICTHDIIGVLKIPKLNVEAPIQDGTSQKIMNICIGHFKESDYWEGNVSLASHNGGINAHYFENINKLNIGDEINYITKYGKKVYKVEKIDEIRDTDWSFVLGADKKKQNNINNTITLITCINGLPDYRLCVRGVESNVEIYTK